MEKVKIGVICPSEIAFRRFMPAVQNCTDIEYIGVAHASAEEWFGEDNTINNDILESDLKKAEGFKETYGGKIYNSYEELIKSDDIDAVYLPLPPALHFKWAKCALENGKNVFVEKPSTTSAVYTKELVRIAREKGLALHENYMFMFHKQIEEINDIVSGGAIGDVRLYRISFGFPMRGKNDFRYNKSLGGGALLDCGGYTIKLASMLLGQTAHIVSSKLNYAEGFEVDIYGSAVMSNDEGLTAQISFGMDNSYKCDLEIWGSKASLNTGRILTAPAGYTPTAEIKSNSGTKTIQLSPDDTFKKSIEYFVSCVNDEDIRKNNYAEIIRQAEFVDIMKEDEK